METKKNRLEDLAEVGHRARQEVEDFLNHWLDDRSKGWAVRTGFLRCSEDRLAAPMAVYLN